VVASTGAAFDKASCLAENKECVGKALDTRFSPEHDRRDHVVRHRTGLKGIEHGKVVSELAAAIIVPYQANACLKFGISSSGSKVSPIFTKAFMTPTGVYGSRFSLN
jgi:hypothetical protein